MPSAATYTFTHSDLTNISIIVENGHLTGTSDWEKTGYSLVWWEYVCSSVTDAEEDGEWETLMRRYMPHQSAAREFRLAYNYLSGYPADRRARSFIQLWPGVLLFSRSMDARGILIASVSIMTLAEKP